MIKHFFKARTDQSWFVYKALFNVDSNFFHRPDMNCCVKEYDLKFFKLHIFYSLNKKDKIKLSRNSLKIGFISSLP